MKKIILILALALGVKVNAQIVGGYLPVNSTKSATMGGLRVNGNETVTGTFSVGSTATVSGNALFSSSVGIGALPTSSLSSFRLVRTGTVDIGSHASGYGSIWLNQSTPSLSNYNITGDGTYVYLNGSTGCAFNSNGVNKALLTSNGFSLSNQTFSVGTSALTGGNTGTVAVLSDAVFPVQFFPSTQSPADGTTYYIGQTLWDWTWSSVTGRVYLPYNCTLVGANLTQKITGTLGTAESVSISVRANNTTDYTLTTTETFSATNKETNITGLSHSLNANDAINIKIVCPTFATNPTNIYLGIVLWFVRRS